MEEGYVAVGRDDEGLFVKIVGGIGSSEAIELRRALTDLIDAGASPEIDLDEAGMLSPDAVNAIAAAERSLRKRGQRLVVRAYGHARRVLEGVGVGDVAPHRTPAYVPFR